MITVLKRTQPNPEMDNIEMTTDAMLDDLEEVGNGLQQIYRELTVHESWTMMLRLLDCKLNGKTMRTRPRKRWREDWQGRQGCRL